MSSSSFTVVPEPALVNTSSTIILRGTTEFDQVTYDTKKEMLVMASLKAPLFEQSAEDRRAPIDICCCIDRSGSMSGPKFDLAKKALVFVLDHLDAKDTMSVVVYGTFVETVLEFTRMTTEGKAKAQDVISSLAIDGGTDLCGGLLAALDLAYQRTSPNEVCSVLLLTDGLATDGITSPSAITAEAEKKLSLFGNSTPSVFTFGFGRDHSEDMLRAISEAGRGMYYYIPTAEEIPVSFADCLGGLQSVVAQTMFLTVEGGQGVRVLKSLSTKYRVEGGEVGTREGRVKLGDLYSDEERDLVFLVEVPGLDEPNDDFVCATFTLTFLNVLTTKEEELTAAARLPRPQFAPPEIKVNQAVDIQKNRLLSAAAMKLSREKASKGDMSGAREVIRSSIECMEKSPSATSPYCSELIRGLNDCQKDLKDREHFTVTGSKAMSFKMDSYSAQRSTSSTLTSPTILYDTPRKKSSRYSSAQ